MRKLALCLVSLAVLLSLSGCSLPGSQPEATPEATATPAPTPSPTPLAVQADATPTPIPVIAYKDYTYETITNEALGVSMKYPSHWTMLASSSGTLTFVEPVEEGDLAMRLSLRVKKLEDGVKLSTSFAKKQFKSYLETLSSYFEEIRAGKISNQLVFMNRTAYSCTYRAYLDGKKVRGFVIMSYVSQNNSIYVLHFYAPSGKYTDAGTVFRDVMYSVVPRY